MRKVILLLLAMFVFRVNAQPAALSWVQIFHGPAADDTATAIAVNTNGDVFVTGGSMTTNGYPDYDYATIKYSSTGLPLWTNFYDGTGNSYDMPAAMGLDSKGNVFVTGVSYGLPISGPDFLTLAYSSNGLPLWTNRYNGSDFFTDEATGLAVDSNDNVCVIGYSGTAYALIKYSNAGLPLWTNFLTGPGSEPVANAVIAIDSNNNLLIAGAALGADSYTHYETAKYSSAGAPMWTNFYVGPGNYMDTPRAVAVDKNGNTFVTGSSWGTGTGYDFATIAYSSAGIPLWTNRYNGPGNDWDGATAIALDINGNVFVTGYSPLRPGGPPHYTTVAYSGSGIPLWTNIYTGGVADDEPSGILVDRLGNVCVTGYSTGGGTSSDYATVEYSGAGLPLWTNRYNGLLNGPDEASAIAADGSRSIFVTGNSDNGYATIKYSPLQPDFLGMENLNNTFVLTWTNAAFSLQCSPVVTGNFTNIPGATSPYTNSITGPQLFFRLQAN